jgi:hypothetical protein
MLMGLASTFELSKLIINPAGAVKTRGDVKLMPKTLKLCDGLLSPTAVKAKAKLFLLFPM